MSSSTGSRRMRNVSPTTCTSVWRLPMCQARRASSCGLAAAISTSGSALPATRMIAPSSSTRPSPSFNAVACGRSSRKAVPPSPVNAIRRRRRSSASRITRSITRELSTEAALRTDDARRIRLLVLRILGEKLEIEDLLRRERTFFGKDVNSDPGFFRGNEGCCEVAFRHLLPLKFAQTGAVLDQINQSTPLLEDRADPTAAAPAGLILPFEKMRQQNLETALDLVLVTPPHALHLVDQVIQIEIVPAALAQKACLLLRPGVEIGLVQLVRARFGLGVGHTDILEQKVPLRHRQHLGRRAGQALAVGGHLVGLGGGRDVRNSDEVHNALHRDAAAGILNR